MDNQEQVNRIINEEDSSEPLKPVDNKSTLDLQVDPRFNAYIALYNNLDMLLWRIPAFLLGATVLGIGLLGNFLAKPESRLFALTHAQSVSLVFAIVGILYGLGTFSMWRIRCHHELLDEELKKMEPKGGYFHSRCETITRKWLSAPHMFIRVFTFFAIGAFVIAFYTFIKGEEKTMTMIIKQEDIAKYGISSKHEQMNNGELRFRLTADDGSGYIRTVAGKNGAWQNSHLHKLNRETYIVQSGWMVLAELRNNKVVLNIFKPSDVVSTEPGIIHNVYLPSGAVIHTVKHGSTSEKDWTPNEEFDKRTKILDEEEILRTARASNKKIQRTGN